MLLSRLLRRCLVPCLCLLAAPAYGGEGGVEDPSLTYERAIQELAGGDPGRALSDLEAIKAEGTLPPDFYLSYGLALFGLRRFQEAEAAFASAEAASPDDGRPDFYLGLLAATAGKAGEA